MGSQDPRPPEPLPRSGRFKLSGFLVERLGACARRRTRFPGLGGTFGRLCAKTYPFPSLGFEDVPPRPAFSTPVCAESHTRAAEEC